MCNTLACPFHQVPRMLQRAATLTCSRAPCSSSTNSAPRLSPCSSSFVALHAKLLPKRRPLRLYGTGHRPDSTVAQASC